MTRFARFMPFLLAASLLLNVFLLGWGAARLARRHGGSPSGFERGQLTPAARALWKERAPSMRAHRRELELRRQAVADALRRDPFDAPALDAALLALRTTSADGQLELHRAIADLARQLPPEERQRLASSRWVLGGSPHGSPDRR